MGGHLRTLPVGETHVGSFKGLGSIAGLVRSSDSDVGGCRCPAARDGRRGENDIYRPLRGIASGFVRARLISCGECELAGLPYVPGSCERPLARCEGRDEVRGTCQPGPADSMATPAEGLSRRSAGRGSIVVPFDTGMTTRVPASGSSDDSSWRLSAVYEQGMRPLSHMLAALGHSSCGRCTYCVFRSPVL